MATPAELALERTDLNDVQLAHIQRLMGTWGILADLSFSDLVLMAPMASPPHQLRTTEQVLVILGQMRPSNSATVVQHDLVGQSVNAADWPVVTASWQSGDVARGEMQMEPDEEPVRLHCIPVRCEGILVAVLAGWWPEPAVVPAISNAPIAMSSTGLL